MKSSLISSWKSGIISGFAFFLTVTILSVGYAVFTSGLSTADRVGTGSGLTSASWNRLVNGVLELDTRTTTMNNGTAKAWVNFDGTVCSPNCTIRASYNVSSVLRNGTGDYTINFISPMTDTNFATTVSGQYNTSGTQNIFTDISSAGTQTSSSVRVSAKSYTNVNYDMGLMSVVIFR